jgi:CheY-like chemotaxis protein/HPt (histidine-containing phosphotransfer) domain-containing protein
MVIMQPRDRVGSRVLLVDDDELSLELVAMLLEAGDYAVTRASNGSEALEHLQTLSPDDFPDVLLLDLQMPGICGAELAEKCRERLDADSFILAMSATRPPPSRLTAYDGFVGKPFTIEAFEAALDNAASGLPSVPGSQADGAYGGDLDDSVYGKLAGMMPAARLHEIYDTCLADTIRRVPVMERLGAAGDLSEVRRIAHGIKGGGSMIGATRIAAIAGELELGAYTVEDVPRLLRDLSSACERLGSILLLSGNKQKGKA